MNFNDGHMHFTGSLSLKYLAKHYDIYLNHNGQVTRNKLFGPANIKIDFKNYPKFVSSYFGRNKSDNVKKFHSLYYFIKAITEKRTVEELSNHYRFGTYDICLNSYLSGGSSITIIAGMSNDIEFTKMRLYSMLKGIEDTEKIIKHRMYCKIRLCFIRDSEKGIKNFDGACLRSLITLLMTDTILRNRIDGFDFCGEENPLDIESIVEILQQVLDYKECLRRKTGTSLNISIHAGEDNFNYSADQHLLFFNAILKFDITHISHGIFLWMPDSIGNQQYEFKNDRIELLKMINYKNICIEICPTANVLLSPLKSYSDINLGLLRRYDVKYTINTDNKTIFNTDIRNEHNFVNEKN